MQKEKLQKLLEAIYSSGNEIISFNEITPCAPDVYFDDIYEFKFVRTFDKQRGKKMIELIQTLESTGYEIILFSRELDAKFRIAPIPKGRK
jgi:hypothetical protein